MLLFISILETVLLGIVGFVFGALAFDKDSNKGNSFVRRFSALTLATCLSAIAVIWVLFSVIQ